MGRKNPLNLYAPENYGTILHSHLKDFDINLAFGINFVALKGNDPVQVMNEKYITATAFPLQHRVESFGFLYREKPRDRNVIKEKIEEFKIPGVRIPAIKKGEDYITPEGGLIKNSDLTIPPPEPLSYAYCSDTKYFRRLPSFVKGVTLLYHEATFDKSLASLAEVTGHSTTLDAARVAEEAGARDLIIGHYSARYKTVNMLVEEARSVFPSTFPAIDGKTYEVGNVRE
jgi:ribonuclease Z